MKSSDPIINERRQKTWTLLTKGMKEYEIAKELDVTHSTVSRDVKYLAAQSQNFLNDLARQTMPFMYEICLDGIRDVIRECYNIYQSDDHRVNMYHKLAALKLIKESHEATFSLLDSGPSVLAMTELQERLALIESRQTN